MERKIIACDVDQTVVNSIYDWTVWLKDEHDFDFNFINDDAFDKEKFSHLLDYWRDEHLYDNMKPFYDAAYYINKLYINHDIWFLTHCITEHKESKKRFLKKYFVFDKFFDIEMNGKMRLDGIIDYIIDDREEILDSFKITKALKISSTIERKTKYRLMTWEEIYDMINT